MTTALWFSARAKTDAKSASLQEVNVCVYARRSTLLHQTATQKASSNTAVCLYLGYPCLHHTRSSSTCFQLRMNPFRTKPVDQGPTPRLQTEAVRGSDRGRQLSSQQFRNRECRRPYEQLRSDPISARRPASLPSSTQYASCVFCQMHSGYRRNNLQPQLRVSHKDPPPRSASANARDC